MTKVAVIGLGKLGYPLASVLSEVGYEVVGFDISQQRVWGLHEGVEISEPEVDISKVSLITTEPEALSDCEFAFLCVNTPSIGTEMDYTQVRSASETLRDHFKGNLLVLSTVLPGACSDIIQPAAGEGILVYSYPIWIALGSVVKDLKSPPAIVLGFDTDDVNPMPVINLLETLTQGSVPTKNITLTDTRTAEMIKLVHNAWCTTKMAFITELGVLSTEGEFDIEAVSNFMINGGERVGAFWKFGPPFGGPCFPRDLRYFLSETNSKLGSAVLDMNKQRTFEIVADLLNKVDLHRKIILLGKSYKFGVPANEESVYLDIAKRLDESGRPGEVMIVDSLHGVEIGDALVVLCHKELESTIPEDVEYIDLWDAEDIRLDE